MTTPDPTISAEEFANSDYYRQLLFDIPQATSNETMFDILTAIRTVTNVQEPFPFANPPNTYPQRLVLATILKMLVNIFDDDDLMSDALTHAQNLYKLDGLSEYWVVSPRLHATGEPTRGAVPLWPGEKVHHNLSSEMRKFHALDVRRAAINHLSSRAQARRTALPPATYAPPPFNPADANNPHSWHERIQHLDVALAEASRMTARVEVELNVVTETLLEHNDHLEDAFRAVRAIDARVVATEHATENIIRQQALLVQTQTSHSQALHSLVSRSITHVQAFSDMYETMAQKEKENCIVILNATQRQGETEYQTAEGYLREIGVTGIPQAQLHAYWTTTTQGKRNLFVKLPNRFNAQLACRKFTSWARTQAPPPQHRIRQDLTTYQREISARIHELLYWCRYHYGVDWKWRPDGAGFVQEYDQNQRRRTVPLQEIIQHAQQPPPANPRKGPAGNETRPPEPIPPATFEYLHGSPMNRRNLIGVFANVKDMMDAAEVAVQPADS